jgi:hypothetical protein
MRASIAALSNSQYTVREIVRRLARQDELARIIHE